MEELTRRLLAPAAIQDKANNVVSVDLTAVVRRLLLFKTYILQSVWLEDLALLVKPFGSAGLGQLIEAGALKVYCESYTVGETGRARADLNFRDKSTRLPLGSYSFSVLRVKDQEARIERALQGLGKPLQDYVSRNLLSVDVKALSSSVFQGFYGDLRQGPLVLESALAVELRKQGVKPKRLKLKIEEVEPEDFRIDHNLSEYGMSDKSAHKVLERALMAIAGLNQRFAEMMTHRALSGITDSDLGLMQGKLGLVAGLMQGTNHERQFDRVISIAGFPTPVLGSTKIDAEKLLKVRDSDECRAVRDWLANIDSLSNKELQKRIGGLSARLKEGVNSRAGKAIRFIVSNGLSLLPGVGTAVGLATSVVDSFVLDRLAPKDAILSFLSESYGSLFKRS